jgi:hypothetical protein
VRTLALFALLWLGTMASLALGVLVVRDLLQPARTILDSLA